MAANDGETAFWGGPSGVAWVDLQEQMDGQLVALGDAAIAAADIAMGERVLDAGCGCGATTIALAQLVGPSGSVAGCDISEAMLARAAQRCVELNVSNASFFAVDVQTASLPGPFDVVFSRFGVMFFDDPVVAFTNMRAATRPGGRLAFVCWQPADLNDFFSVIGQAANRVLGPPEPMPPDAPGPTAFGDPERVRTILGDAGWRAVGVAECRRTMQAFGTSDLEKGIAGAMRIGGMARRLVGQTPEITDWARAAVRSALADRWTPNGWMTDGVCWVVTASN